MKAHVFDLQHVNVTNKSSTPRDLTPKYTRDKTLQILRRNLKLPTPFKINISMSVEFV